MALLCSPSLFASTHGRQHLLFRNESGILLNQKKYKLKAEKVSVVCSSCGASFSSLSSSSRPSSGNGVLRRDLMLFGLCSFSGFSGSNFRGGIKKAGAILISRAIISIVSERVDIFDNLVISVSAPQMSEFIKSKDKSIWNAKDVADSALSDNADVHGSESHPHSDWLRALFLMHTQLKLMDIGQPYWVYEYLVRKSPTKNVQEPNLYRHYVASTFERDGYLYSLSASTLNIQWDEMGPFLERTVSSFRLLPSTDEYVAPYKDPWRFW
ncbi:unnamed protein product [Linum tenue]|uniref:PsbP C-terminal domain-containing protein n=1 Tax=Linum tenue TaxID=586396 RepID=A0AAV0JZG0_9ROSI|nr:unnamed protein product [Linum tenue]